MIGIQNAKAMEMNSLTFEINTSMKNNHVRIAFPGEASSFVRNILKEIRVTVNDKP
jgi:hypothetical protein